MSGALYIVLSCDGLNCDCPPFTSTYDEIGAARHEAAEKGWTTIPTSGGDTDWGPAHIGLKVLTKEN